VSRRDTLAQAAWRIQVFAANGRVTQEDLFCTGDYAVDGHNARKLFDGLNLVEGSRAEYQIRQEGKSRFQTWGRKEQRDGQMRHREGKR